MGNVYNKVGYTPEAAASFDDIFRKPRKESSPEPQCTHGRGFCALHQGDCEVHFFLMGDGRCSCKPCFSSTKSPEREKHDAALSILYRKHGVGDTAKQRRAFWTQHTPGVVNITGARTDEQWVAVMEASWLQGEFPYDFPLA